MNTSSRAVRPWARRLLLLLPMSLVMLACILWDLAGVQIDQDVYSLTHTAYADQLTENARLATDDAYWDQVSRTQQAQTLDARDVLARSTVGPHDPPVITDVDFPSLIPGDGTTYYGELYFRDEWGDVNRLTIEVIRADNFGGADYDPRPYLIRGDAFQGVYQLYIWCEGKQSVTLRVTLYDSMGGRSNSKEFTFTCD